MCRQRPRVGQEGPRPLVGGVWCSFCILWWKASDGRSLVRVLWWEASGGKPLVGDLWWEENIRKCSKSAISRSLTWCATLLTIFLKYFLRFLGAGFVQNEFIEFMSTPPTSYCTPVEKYSKIMPYFSGPANVKVRTR